MTAQRRRSSSVARRSKSIRRSGPREGPAQAARRPVRGRARGPRSRCCGAAPPAPRSDPDPQQTGAGAAHRGPAADKEVADCGRVRTSDGDMRGTGRSRRSDTHTSRRTRPWPMTIRRSAVSGTALSGEDRNTVQPPAASQLSSMRTHRTPPRLRLLTGSLRRQDRRAAQQRRHVLILAQSQLRNAYPPLATPAEPNHVVDLPTRVRLTPLVTEVVAGAAPGVQGLDLHPQQRRTPCTGASSAAFGRAVTRNRPGPRRA